MTENERDDVVVLTDDQGNEFEFHIIDVLEVEGNRYAVLFPLDEEEADEDEALIMRLEMDANGDDVLVDIDDDQEWDRVVAEWESMLEDDEDFDEEEEPEDETDK